MSFKIGKVSLFLYKIKKIQTFLKLYSSYKNCVQDCNAALQIDCTLAKAFYRRMQAMEALQDYESALADCEEVIKLQPKNEDAKQRLIKILKLMTTTGK